MVLAALAVPFLPLATAVALDPVPEAAVMVVTEVDLDVRVVGPDGRDVGDREAGLNATAVHGDEAPFEADMVVADHAFPAGALEDVDLPLVVPHHHAVALGAGRAEAIDVHPRAGRRS